MSRYIDADAFIDDLYEHEFSNWCYKDEVSTLVYDAPSIDIVHCGECKWSKANGTYQWCGRLDSTARITADDFCSCGERNTDSNASNALKVLERSSE